MRIKANLAVGVQCKDVCLTEECVKAASMLLESIDSSTNPCDDFFQFSCGMWIKNHVIPEDKSLIGIFLHVEENVKVILKNILEMDDDVSDVESVKKARRYYRSCIDVDQIENLTVSVAYPYLRDLGGWPVLEDKAGGNFNNNEYNLEDMLIKIREYTNSPPIMDMYVEDDVKDPMKHVLYIDQPVLGMPERTYFLNGRNEKTLLAYQTFATEMAKLFGADSRTAKQDMQDMVDFEIELANISMPQEDRIDDEKLYNPMTIEQLKGNYSNFDWLKYFKATLGKPGINITVDLNEKVIVSNPDYISKVFEIVKSKPNRVIANYIVWRAVKWIVRALPTKAREVEQVYKQALEGTSSVPPRWKTCSSQINDEFGMAVGRLFINEAFHVDAKATALEMIEALRASMKELISDTDWMDETTKSAAKDKADHIQPQIGFSDHILNDDKLHEKYYRLHIGNGDYFGDTVRSMKFSTIENLEKLRKPVDRTKWDTPPGVVDAYYTSTRNQISFTAAILQPPFFSRKYPKYLNYGGIGYVIGHEITHGFDNSGRLYDKDGNLHQWWGQSSIDNFKERANCTINQYNSYKVAEANKYLNGKLTLGENIADNGGLKESFKAYRKWVKKNGKEEQRLPGLTFTPNQLFFLNAAHVWCESFRPEEAELSILVDVHSHPRYRVIGSFQYNEDFAETFNCPKGSYMNPEERCKIW